MLQATWWSAGVSLTVSCRLLPSWMHHKVERSILAHAAEQCRSHHFAHRMLLTNVIA